MVRAVRARILPSIAIAVFAGSLFSTTRAWSFENAEHKYASQLALSSAATDGSAADISKFQALTLAWTYGIDYLGVFYGNPSEQLAHLQNQSLSVSYTAAINGGDFTQIRRNVRTQYLQFNFGRQSAGGEGAYVWLGAALHLIEDQASLPHAANVWHDLDDNFEGGDPEIVLGSHSSKFGGLLTKDASANVAVEQAYAQSLTRTQSAITSNQCSTQSGQASCYLYNVQLSRGAILYQGSADQQAQFVGNGTCGSQIVINQICYDPQWYGDYGGPLISSGTGYPTTSRQDIYSESGLFNQQGTQAANFAYFFLRNISKTLPPLITRFESTSPIVGPGSPTTLAFRTMDNASAQVKVDLRVIDTNGVTVGKIATDEAIISISTNDALSGSPPSPVSFPSGTAWDNLEVSQYGTDQSNINILPFEADYSLTWSGVLSGGATLTPGTYALCLNVRDGDNNDSSQTSSLCDQSVRFSVGPRPILQTVTVLSSSGTVRYSRSWVQEETGYGLVISSAPLGRGDYTLRLAFSTAVSVDQASLVGYGPISLDPAFHDVVTTTITFSTAIPQGIGNVLSIAGHDSHLNQLLALTPDVSTITFGMLDRAEDGVLLGVGGADSSTVIPIDVYGPHLRAFSSVIENDLHQLDEVIALGNLTGAVTGQALLGDSVGIDVTDDQQISSLTLTADQAATPILNEHGPFDEFGKEYTLSLKEGLYHLAATDEVGNESRVDFKTDYGVSDEITSRNETNREVGGVSKAFWGVRRIKMLDTAVYPDFNHFTSTQIENATGVMTVNGDSATSKAWDVSGLANGNYVVLSVDALDVTSLTHQASSVDISTQPDGLGGYVVHMTTGFVPPPFFTATGSVYVQAGGQRIPVDIVLHNVTAEGGTSIRLNSLAENTVGNSRYTLPIGSNLGFVMSTGADYDGTADVTIGYDANGLTSEQESGIKLVQIRNGSPVDVTTSLDTAQHKVTGAITGTDPIAVSVPVPSGGAHVAASTTQVAGQPELAVTSYHPDSTLSLAPAVSTFVAQLFADQNLALAVPAYSLTDSTISVFSPRAQVVGRFDRAAVTAAGVDPDTVQLYVLKYGGTTLQLLAHPSRDAAGGAVSGDLTDTVGLLFLLGKRNGPVTSLLVQGSTAPRTGGFVMKAGDALSLSATGGSPIAASYLKIDSGSEQVAASTFTLAEGVHTLIYRSVDTAGRAEPAKNAIVRVDGTAPTVVFASTGTGRYMLTATDPLGGGIAAGVGSVLYGVDVDLAQCSVAYSTTAPAGTCANPFYAGPFALADGTHTVTYGAADLVGNGLGVYVSTSFLNDVVPPVTTASGDGVAPGFVRDGSQVAMTASDAETGVAQTYYAFDPSTTTLALGLTAQTTGLFQNYLGAFVVTSGSHLLAYASLDNAGNFEALKTLTVDGAAPATTGVGAWVGPARDVTLVSTDALSGVATVYYLVDASTSQVLSSATAGAFAVYAAPFRVSTAAVRLGYGAVDRVGNYELLHLAGVDATAPATTLSADRMAGGVVAGGATVTLSASDAESGVAAVYYAVDPSTALVAAGLTGATTAQFSVYAGTFAVPGSATALAYGALDAAGNFETLHVASVDGVAPVTSLSAARRFGSFVAPGTITLTASDAGSGVAATYYQFDLSTAQIAAGLPAAATTQFLVYGGTFTASAASRSLAFASKDAVGNAEALHVVAIDTAAPGTTFTAASLFQGFVRAGDPVLLVSTDALSGVATTYYGVGLSTTVTNQGLSGATTGFYLVYSTSGISLAAGQRNLAFGSLDRVGNYELLRSTSLRVDGTSPTVTIVSTSGGSGFFAISATDPQNSGFASGVSTIAYLVDAAPASCAGVTPDPAAAPGTCANQAYAGRFFLAFGTHTVYASAPDRVGNGLGVFTSSAVLSRDLAPTTTIQYSGYQDYVKAGSGINLQATAQPGFSVSSTYFKVDPSTALLAGGLSGATTGQFTRFTSPFSLAEGTHTVAFGSVDNQAHYETLKTVLLRADGTAPTVALGLSGTSYALTANDPTSNGVASGLNQLIYLVDTDPNSCSSFGGNPSAPAGTCGNPFYAGPFALAAGTHTVVWDATDRVGNELFASTSVTVAPASLFAVSTGPIGSAFTLSGSGFGSYDGSNTRVRWGASGPLASLSQWTDTTIAGTVPGVSTGAYAVQLERQTGSGTTITPAGTYTVLLPTIASVTPSTGPSGVPFALAGSAFGAYGGSATRVRIGGVAASLSAWTDTSIAGTVPALTTGTWDVVVERQTDSFTQASPALQFQATALAVGTLSPSTAPVGAPFTVTGTGFGPYAGSATRLLIGGISAPLSTWNDTTIAGTIPTLSAGPQPLWIERSADGGVQASATVYLNVVLPRVDSVTPSTGPTGAAFALSGAYFGPYAGDATVALIGGATASLSAWSDTAIAGTVPGGLSIGAQPVVVGRRGPDGAWVYSPASTFTVTGIAIASLDPSTGPVGVPFTLTGGPFGAYGGSNTRVKFGGVEAPLSSWTDASIAGTIPGLAPGAYSVVVERQSGADVQSSAASTFTLTALTVGALSPSTAPIGAAFTVTGTGFGPYAGSSTRLLIGGVAAPLSTWNDTTIAGTIPGLSAGSQPVWIERQAGSFVQSGATVYLTVVLPAVASVTPSSAPIGAPFALSGTGFGAYAGSATRVKIGGYEAPLSAWSDTAIAGTVPGQLSTGTAALVVERATADGGLAQSATQAFLVLLPAVSTMTPSYGPADTVVTLSGSGFGPYAGSATRVLIGGATVPLSVWNDSTIVWTVPALADGDYPVVVERAPSGGVVDGPAGTFSVGSGGSGGAAFGLRAPTALAAKPDVYFQGDLLLSADQGGRVQTPAKAAVQLPPRALDADAEITVRRARKDASFTAAAAAAKVQAAGEPIEFGPDGTRFNTPVTIELPYDPALAGDETKLVVGWFDPVKRAWETLASTVDVARRVVTARTAHFSLYQPMAPVVQSAAQDAFDLRAAYAFPNPSRGGQAVLFRAQPGLADSVEVRVYDQAGRLVHSSADFRYEGLQDDGNGLGAQHTYEHAWDVSGVGSGVYRWALRARKAGSSDQTKSGKAGVIK